MTASNRRSMRLDRFLTMSIFHPLIGFTSSSHDVTVPILMYHSIADDVDDNVHPYYRTVTAPATFEKHMRFLRESNYEVLTLSEAVRFLRAERVRAPERLKSPMSPDPMRRSVVITFDDGLRDFYTAAFPILEGFGFRATVFLTSGYIDKIFITGRECLRTREVGELAEKGVEFGSHTVTHPQLSGLSTSEIVRELRASKRDGRKYRRRGSFLVFIPISVSGRGFGIHQEPSRAAD